MTKPETLERQIKASVLLKPEPAISKLLPPEARRILIGAARVNMHIEPGLDPVRRALVDDAITRVKTMFPDHFKQEQ